MLSRAIVSSKCGNSLGKKIAGNLSQLRQNTLRLIMARIPAQVDFFASNEIKVIMIYLLMNYDWKGFKGGMKEDRVFGVESEADPTARTMIKRRESGVNL